MERILESLVVLCLVFPVVILLRTHMLELFFEVLLVLERLMTLFWMSLCWQRDIVLFSIVSLERMMNRLRSMMNLFVQDIMTYSNWMMDVTRSIGK